MVMNNGDLPYYKLEHQQLNKQKKPVSLWEGQKTLEKSTAGT